MNPALIIHSHEQAYEQVKWSWPAYQLPGWDIIGVTPEDSIHTWPPSIAACLAIGKAGYCTTELIQRHLATLDHLLRIADYDKYTHFAVIEYDGVFLRQPPPLPERGFFTHLAGGPIEGFKASRFFHCPWIMDRKTAEAILFEGTILTLANEFEKGSPDFFYGLITDRRPDIEVFETETWSSNGGGLAYLKEHAEKAVKEGAFFVHGVRTKEELEWLKGLV